MLEVHNFTQNEIDEKFFDKVTKTVLDTVGVKDRVEISLAIVGDGRMRKLNKIYRGKNRVTDVLSFGNKSVLKYLSKAFPRLEKGKEIEFVEAPDGVKKLGEVILCYPQAKKQARRANHSLELELTILLIHGVLHLLEYDHEKDEKQAEEMKEIEDKILKTVNI